MPETTYTMFVGTGAGAEEIVARGVTLPRALVLALEHGGRGRAGIVYSDIGSLRHFAIGRRPEGGGDTPRSRARDYGEDHAQLSLERKLLDGTGEFWGGRVETDEAHARRKAMGQA